MWKQKLGISVSKQFPLPPKDLVCAIGSAGFDAISPRWYHGYPMEETASACYGQGLVIQSLHAPFLQVDQMWSDKVEESSVPLMGMLAALEDCHRYGVKVMVAHAWIGFEYDQIPNEAGFCNFDQVVEKAEQYGVKIALENTEGEEFLASLMARYANTDTVGFCWDSGHEMCYNHNQDMLALYGDRLYMTHLNDNVGIRNFEGIISPFDDIHLLPYDGIIHWEEKLRNLKKARAQEILNFEVNNFSRENRHDNDHYAKMSLEEYFAAAYRSACRIGWNYQA